MRIYFILLLSCLCNVWSIAQESPFFYQKHINSENGFPQNTVRDLMFSPSGFLWIATENGLVRYDGKSCRIYNSTNSGLPRNRIGQLIPMNDGRLYCFAEEENLSEIIETSHSTKVQFIKKMKHIGFTGYHLFKADSVNMFSKICDHIFPENYEEDSKSIILVLQGQHKYVQRTKNGIAVFDMNAKFLQQISISNTADINFFVDHDELYGKTNSNQFFHIDIVHGELKKCDTPVWLNQDIKKQTASLNDHLFFYNYKNNSSFLIEHNSLYEIRVVNNTVLMDLKIQELPGYAISSIIASPDQKNLIVGTRSSGIFVYCKKNFENVTSPFSDNLFYAQTYFKPTKHVLTSTPFLQFDIDGKSSQINDMNVNKQTLFTDSKDRIWFAGGDTVWTYDLKKQKTILKTTVPDIKGNGIGFIDARDSTSLYISTNNTLFSFDENHVLQKLGNYTNKVPVQRAFCMQKLNDSIIYIATDVGIYKYSTLSHKMILCCLTGQNVRTLYKTRTGLLLAGTYDKGYYVITQDSAIAIPLDKNENLKSTHCFIEDDYGFLWMSSNNGLYKIALYEITQYLKYRHKQTLYYYRYSHEDGLLTNEFNGGCFPSALQIDSSKWSLPSMQGLVWFEPNKLNSTFNSSELFIDKAILNDSIIHITDQELIRIVSHDFKMELYISSPNWTDVNNVYIEYIIDPSNENETWTLLKDNNNPIIIQNLKGGEHKLVIRKKNGDRGNDYRKIELKIQVPKLLNEYSWFWPVTILMLLAMMYSVAKLATFLISKQKKRLEKMVDDKTYELKQALHALELQHVTIIESEASLTKENEIKNTLLFLLSHDIASPLRFINRFLSGANAIENASTLSKEDLVDLTISTQNLEALLDNIVIWIKQTLDSFNEIEIGDVDVQTLVNEKLKLFQLAIKKKNNVISNELPSNLILHSNRFILSMAIQNILGNAINFTKQGTIRMTYQQSHTGHTISVIDSGKSTVRLSNHEDEHLAGYGIGLKITKELLKLIDGEIQLEPLKNNEGMKASIYIREKTNLHVD